MLYGKSYVIAGNSQENYVSIWKPQIL